MGDDTGQHDGTEPEGDATAPPAFVGPGDDERPARVGEALDQLEAEEGTDAAVDAENDLA